MEYREELSVRDAIDAVKEILAKTKFPLSMEQVASRQVTIFHGPATLLGLGLDDEDLEILAKEIIAVVK